LKLVDTVVSFSTVQYCTVLREIRVVLAYLIRLARALTENGIESLLSITPVLFHDCTGFASTGNSGLASGQVLGA